MFIEFLKLLVFYIFVIGAGVAVTRLSKTWASPNRRLILIALLGIGSIVLIRVLGITNDPLSKAMFNGSLLMLMMSAVIYSAFLWYEMKGRTVNQWIKVVAYVVVFAAIAASIVYAQKSGAEALSTLTIIFQVCFILALIAHAVITYMRIKNFTDMLKQ